MISAVKKYQAIISASLLAFTALIGIPSKAYTKQVKYNPICIEREGKPLPWTKHMAKTYAHGLMRMEYPQWGRGEWSALSKLWGKESAWNHEAANPKSSAYGIAQILRTKPGTPAPVQIDKGLSYIKHRYDKPSVAWSHWRKHKWY